MIVSELSTPVVLCDATGRIAEANPSAEAILGRSRQTLLRQWLTEVLRSHCIGGIEPLLGSLTDPVASSGTARVRFGRPDGSVLDLEARWTRLADQVHQGWLLWELHRLPEISQIEQSWLVELLGMPGKTVQKLGSRPSLDRILHVAIERMLEDLHANSAAIWLASPGLDRPFLRAGGVPGRIQVNADRTEELLDSAWIPVVAFAEEADARIRGDKEVVETSLDDLLVVASHRRSLVTHPLEVDDVRLGILACELPEALPIEGLRALESYAAVLSAAITDHDLLNREHLARLSAEADQKRFQTMVERIPVGVALAEGADGRLTFLNPTGRTLWGLEAPPCTIRDFHRHAMTVAVEGTDQELPQQPLWRALNWAEQVHETIRYQLPNGRERVLEVQAAPFPGPAHAAIATYHDITDRVELQTELSERAAQFKALLDHLPVGVAYFDADCYCRACNGPAWGILGRTRSQMIGAAAQEVFTDTPSLLEAVQQCVAEHKPHSQTNTPWTDGTRGGEVRYLEWRFEPLPSSSTGKPLGALALIVDVTGRKRADDALRAAKEAAELSAKNKSRFLSAISHDLRTPVNALNLLARLVADLTTGTLDSDRALELSHLVTDFRRASSNLVELVNDLLDLTRFDSGEVAQHPVRFRLAEWLDSLLSPLALEAGQKHLRFQWELDPPSAEIRADRVKLGRVLTNLVGNALKFTQSGSVEVQVGVRTNDTLLLSVRDTGPGIPGEQLDRIFDEFAQLRNPERDRTKGTGLGLAICRRLVEAVGGTLSVASEVGLGSTFQVVYPVEVVQDIDPETTPGRNPVPTLEPPPTPQDSNALLLVEDDDATRISMAMLLEHCGYEVITAADGLEALDRLEAQRPAVVLLDLMMPGLDGTEVLRSIRLGSRFSDLPVIILSGDVLDERLSQLKELGATAILAKPINFDELLETVSRYVELAVPEA